jgi:hypothetical protein
VWRRVHPATLADQAIQFLRDLGEILIDAAAELKALRFKSDTTFTVRSQ